MALLILGKGMLLKRAFPQLSHGLELNKQVRKILDYPTTYVSSLVNA